MRFFLFNRITLVWFLLVAATALSWEMGHGSGEARHAGVAIIVVAFIKLRFVILELMEIRYAPRFMRVVAEVWTVIVCTTLVTLFWTAKQ
ncbi:MAG: hypothetical protein JWQ90_795 [Hydrocarboniphaga sp.]|uniref:cytochrome C oxidase subunit IV family protein n=1 Tax=Hydrocarboniphaga sp. TaxID=2033016 RepID=UPI00262CF19D|nr:cytochrome C oxidase subunit IV family protein [Hydrocarboniphaga sp.]MDB5968345.1 hypothetical protein [Hydrocarboniphaga sp.]